jgi:hypothetical protein
MPRVEQVVPHAGAIEHHPAAGLYRPTTLKALRTGSSAWNGGLLGGRRRRLPRGQLSPGSGRGRHPLGLALGRSGRRRGKFRCGKIVYIFW